ncbi:MAG: DPP IV N-terminal domain-containing protein [Chitinophagales bacterium]|nr:DPP IV N-terminal domain-containing protein [Chitinophagales bacterium]
MNILRSSGYIFIATTLLANTAIAQKKQYTMAEATNGIYTTLAPEGIKSASWEPGSNKLYHVVKAGNDDALISVRFPDLVTDTVIRLDELNTKLDRSGKLKSMPAINWIDKGLVWIKDGEQLYQGTATGGGYMWSKWVTVPKEAENLTIDKYQNVVYTVANNLYMITRDKRTLTVTDDKNEHIINGQSVHRNEFGINGGIFLSPQGNYLAYYHMDETMVADYPIVDWSVTPATPKEIKYPMAGGTSHQVKLHVYNPSNNRTTIINTQGPADQYLPCITWSPDESYIYIAVLNREQDHMWLNQYDAKTGEFVKTLFEETSDKYVEPLTPLTFIPGTNDRFVWRSQRDGYMHMYLYNTDGKMLKQLTKGDWVVNDIAGTIESEHKFIITGSKDSPLEEHAYTVEWRNGRIAEIDPEAGWHSVSVNDNGLYMLDVFSSGDVAKKTEVRSTDGKYSHLMKESGNPLVDYDRPEVRSVTLKADDGTPLYGRLIMPVDFDANKKYPVIVYLYNGPHVQLIRNSFPASRNLWYEYLAQHGYVVFSMDGRGSGNRGLAFEQATFGKLGTVEMEDQLKGVEYLKTLPFVDANRMGVHGWSFGGFMTTSLMMRHPDVFKVGVAGGPVIDWNMYEVMYTERYMDSPKNNKAGYDANNLLNHVDRLKGKLLIIHGAQDDVVVWQHSMKLIRKSVELGKQIDYFVYPSHPHNVRGKDRVHLMQKITDYFDLYLKP